MYTITYGTVQRTYEREGGAIVDCIDTVQLDTCVHYGYVLRI